MGYEDAEGKSATTGDTGSTAISDTPLDETDTEPRSRSHGTEREVEMRNLSRSRSPVEGLRRRLSMDPEARKERKAKAEERKNQREVPVAVVEQRLSNLAQGCLCEYRRRSLSLGHF